jgi:phosphoketolase
MPAHIPRALPTKKLEILAKRELSLRKILAHSCDHGNGHQLSQAAPIIRACESLRIAKLGVIKVALAARNPNEGLTKPLRNQQLLIDALKHWTTIPTLEIIALYKGGT